jgi:hypothetical protein
VGKTMHIGKGRFSRADWESHIFGDRTIEPRIPERWNTESFASLGWALLADNALKAGDVSRAEELMRIAYIVAEKTPRSCLACGDLDFADGPTN